MKISEIIEFLERVKNQDGDLRMQSITGLWVKTIPATGELVVVPAIKEPPRPIEEFVR